MSIGVACPHCGDIRSSCIDVRPGSEFFGCLSIKRRRVCTGCRERYTAYEISEAAIASALTAINASNADTIVSELLQIIERIQGASDYPYIRLPKSKKEGVGITPPQEPCKQEATAT